MPKIHSHWIWTPEIKKLSVVLLAVVCVTKAGREVSYELRNRTPYASRTPNILPLFLPRNTNGCTHSALQPRFATVRELLRDPRSAKILSSLKETPRPHRKQWEFVFIVKALEDMGMLKPGKRGLVFAAGHEPLISYFASQGVEIVATDMDGKNAERLGWSKTNQHAEGLLSLHDSRIVSRETFERLVSFRVANMNVVYAEFVGKFDFVWSTCSLEHVGSITLGQRFAVNTMEYLKPGGAAVHTTEFTLSSLARTVKRGETVLWRMNDVQTLRNDLIELGYAVEEVCWDAGRDVLDLSPDVPPYTPNRHIKLLLMDHVATSVGWVSRKGRKK